MWIRTLDYEIVNLDKVSSARYNQLTDTTDVYIDGRVKQISPGNIMPEFERILTARAEIMEVRP